MKIPILLLIIIGVAIFLMLRRKPAVRVRTVDRPPTRAATVAQMIERYAEVAGQDEALAMLAKLDLDPNAPVNVVNALRHAPGMSRAIAKAVEAHAPQATPPPRTQKHKAAKPAAEHHARVPVADGLREEIEPLGALPHLPPLRHMRPLPKLAVLAALPPLGPIRQSAVRSARSDSWRS